MISNRELLKALHAARVGRDGLIAALLPRKARMGLLFAVDVAEIVQEVDAFLAAAAPPADTPVSGM